MALKKLKSPEFMKQFMEEAEFLQTLTHPYIVMFLGIFDDNGITCIKHNLFCYR